MELAITAEALIPATKFVVMTHAKLGDFLVVTPHLKKLEELYPELIVAVPDFLCALYEEQKIFKRSIAQSELQDCLRFIGKSDNVYNLSFPLLNTIRIDPSHHKLNGEFFKRPQHVSRSYAQALNEFFSKMPEDFQAAPFLDFNSEPETLKFFGVKAFQYFTVHSGSDFEAKNWAAQNFEEVVERFLKAYPHIECLSFVGPSDQELFQQKPKPSRFKTIRSDIRTVAHLLMSSLFHVDNDSGVHHLAGAANVPSITIFGATAPGTWSSLTKRNYIHWGRPNCTETCENNHMKECLDRICLSSVKPEHLVGSAEQIMSAYSRLT